MRYDLARPISNAYSVAADLEFLVRSSYGILFDGPNYLGADPERIQGFWEYLNDYKNGESRLLVRANRALSAHSVPSRQKPPPWQRHAPRPQQPNRPKDDGSEPRPASSYYSSVVNTSSGWMERAKAVSQSTHCCTSPRSTTSTVECM